MGWNGRHLTCEEIDTIQHIQDLFTADMDGLLLNTETFYTIVQKQILAKYGKEFTWDLKAQVSYPGCSSSLTLTTRNCRDL